MHDITNEKSLQYEGNGEDVEHRHDEEGDARCVVPVQADGVVVDGGIENITKDRGQHLNG